MAHPLNIFAPSTYFHISEPEVALKCLVNTLGFVFLVQLSHIGMQNV